MTSAEVVDLAVDQQTRELARGPDGGPYVVTGRAASIQLCWAAMRQARGEFFTDLQNEDDLPLEPNDVVADADAYLGDARFDRDAMVAQYRRCLLAVPGVVAVPSIDARLDAARGATVSAVVVIGFDDDPAREELLNA